MATVVFNGAQGAFILSDAANLDEWPLVIDGINQFIIGVPFKPTIITGVVGIPADCPRGLLVATAGVVTWPGYAAWKAAQVAAQQAVLAQTNVPLITASYNASLQRQAAKLAARGKTAQATALYLQAAGVLP